MRPRLVFKSVCCWSYRVCWARAECRLKQWVYLFLLLSGCTVCCAAEEYVVDHVDLPTSPAISSSKRFVVKGLTTPENVDLSVWLEDIAAAVERVLNMSLGFERGEPLQLVMLINPDDDNGHIYMLQDWLGSRLQQQVRVVNPGQVDQEDVLESLVALMLNRYPIARQSVADRKEHLAEIPEWLAVGVSQNLFASQQNRNNQDVLASWQDESLPGLKEIIATYPSSHVHHKAWLGAATQWMLNTTQGSALLEQIFDDSSTGKTWSVENLQSLLPVKDFGEIEQQWELWVVSLQQLRRDWGEVSYADLDDLRESLLVRPEVISLITREDVVQQCTLYDLINQRDAEWMPALSRFMEMRVQSLGIGRSSDFQLVLNQYALFFHKLGLREKGLFKKSGAQFSAEDLHGQLDVANKALLALEASMQP